MFLPETNQAVLKKKQLEFLDIKDTIIKIKDWMTN